ncbi:hypothetical protein H0H92_014444 [Tricholoma furcatifolium]|nr:hypothetical protein H0H92_014444 [Tricholoma furcatifolium]
MEKTSDHNTSSARRPSKLIPAILFALCSLSIFLPFIRTAHYFETLDDALRKHPDAATIIEQCNSLKAKAGPPTDFHKRRQSDRFVSGTKPVLIKRARIWTGARNGTEVIHGDILLDKGLIKSVGHLYGLQESYGESLLVVDAKGAWVTPGIVDIHSHLGDAPLPALDGAEDDNSMHGTIQPWLRSLDGLNTHDDSYPLSIAGGVTTALILPGSSNAIGGQAFPIKLRSTKELSDANVGRLSYKKAHNLMTKQDEYCELALAGKWKGLGSFPQDLQWEALVDVVRGRVKVNAHCYEAVDLDALVRVSNEFKFPIAAFHHASEAYLVPDLLKKTYGGTPAVALFATNSRYKREAYRSSEFAPRILASHGIKVVLKSDHPVSNSRYLLYEAQQAYYYGLPENLAIASVTSTAAQVMGIDHRVGMDADLVIWDSHPLALGATPSQVYIDGIPQLEVAHVVAKPQIFQNRPKVPNFDKEAAQAVEYEGLPPIAPNSLLEPTIVFTNVTSIYARTKDSVEVSFSARGASEPGTVVVQDGYVVCSGTQAQCLSTLDASGATIMDLKGGSIAPGLVSFGSPLGLHHIEQEDSTNDGDVFDPFVDRGVPKVVGGDTAIVRAVDGLLFGSRDAYLAFRAGVTSAVTAPTHKNFYSGLATSFSLGAPHGLEAGAVIQEVTGIHVAVRAFSKPSISSQIAALRRLLLGKKDGASGYWFNKVIEGEIPLVVEAHSADIIATLIVLKKEVEHQTGRPIKMTITGASEAHILSKELGEAGIGIILNPPRPFPYTWEDRRILPGPPLSEDSAIMKLLAHGVTVGIGCEEIWSARNLPFDVAWAAIEAGGKISRSEALALGSANIQKLLGVKIDEKRVELVVTRGGDLLDQSSEVVAVLSPGRGTRLFN